MIDDSYKPYNLDLTDLEYKIILAWRDLKCQCVCDEPGNIFSPCPCLLNTANRSNLNLDNDESNLTTTKIRFYYDDDSKSFYFKMNKR